MKNAKNILIFSTLVLMFLSASNLISQTIHFCESNITDGAATGEKSKFVVDPMKESFVYILVNLPGAYGCNVAKFRREKVGEPGPYMNLDVSTDATWFVYEMYLPQQGDYKLSVYDCNDNVIGSGNITVVYK